MENKIKNFRSCSRCILDTNDYPDISFDEQGVCSICHIYDDLVLRTIYHGNKAESEINKMILLLQKSKRKSLKYDCIIGISGGVDSTYLAYLSKEWGLKPLFVHVDNGWNTELAVKNIEETLKKLSFDLYTYVIDWEDMKDMQLSFLRASVLDIELPFDNAFVAALYKVARKFHIKNILLGYNTATEGWLPPNFTHYKLDSINIHAIHKKYGTRKIKNFPTIGVFKRLFYEKIVGIKLFSPLNWVDYNKNKVKQLLIDKLNWRDYGNKHYENIFTRFYQGYILPHKFGIDKRKSHLSTLICSGQMSKQEALEELNKPIYETEQLISDKEFVLKKLGLKNSEFDEIMNLPIRKHTDFPSYVNWFNYFRKIKKFLKRK